MEQSIGERRLAYDECFYARTAYPQRSLLFQFLLPRLSVFPPSQQCEGPRRGFSKNMSCSVSVDNCDMVHPATDAYAGEAVEALKTGSLEAVNRIYEIKGRKHTSPLASCVGDVSDIARFAVTDHLPHGLLDCLLPGPESSILERSLNPGFDSIGVRVPDCNFIRIIACGSGTALALTSANLILFPSKILRTSGNIAFVYDGGLIPSSLAGSMVVDLTTPHKYKILRPGSAKEETVAILEKHSLVEAETT
ncbi:YrdC domain-containing protein, mitochondrial [Glycine soja]